MRRFLCNFLIAALSLQAQVSTFAWSDQFNYSNQFTGINLWPNNGRHSFGDSTRATWCLDGNTYVSGDDGYGPNYVYGFGVGRNIFMTTVSPFTVPAAGALQTGVNGMNSWGHATQDIWGNNTSIKSSGDLCNKDAGTGIESLYWSNYQQSMNDNQTGSCVNILRSDDHAGSWWNPEHINHTTGAPTQAADPNGDVTSSAASCMFPPDIKSIIFQQYCQGNFNCPVIDNNNNWIYGLAESQLGQHMYAWRLAPLDIKKLDGSIYQWYDGPIPSSTAAFNNNSNWTLTEASKVAVEPSVVANIAAFIGPTIYIPLGQRYMTVIGTLTSQNLLLQAPTLAGPWVELFDFAADGLSEGWHTPMLASLSAVANNAQTVNYLVTNGPGGIDTSNPQFNTYGVMFHVATFAGFQSSQVKGLSAVKGLSVVK